MSKVSLKNDQMVVYKEDFGFLVEEFILKSLRFTSISAEWLNTRLREWWPTLEEWHQRHILTHIEAAIALDEPPRYGREPMDPLQKFMWVQFVKDLRPPKHPFTVKYRCDKCKTKDVKLWRGVHGCADDNGHKLLCATCLVPDIKVSEQGKCLDTDMQMDTDQIAGWLPAIPVDNTYWGYSSVPSQDVEWWVGLPTYTK